MDVAAAVIAMLRRRHLEGAYEKYDEIKQKWRVVFEESIAEEVDRAFLSAARTVLLRTLSRRPAKP